MDKNTTYAAYVSMKLSQMYYICNNKSNLVQSV